MRRSWLIWLIFCAGSAAALAGMGWISLSLLGLDARVRHDNQLEENIRLALWRMDSLVNPLILQESARGFGDGSLVNPANYMPARQAQIDDERILARFQIDCEGKWMMENPGDGQAVRELQLAAPTLASLGLCDPQELIQFDNPLAAQELMDNMQVNNASEAPDPAFMSNLTAQNQQSALNRSLNNNFIVNSIPQNSLAGMNNSPDNNIAMNGKSINEFNARQQTQFVQQRANVAVRNFNNDPVSQIREGPMGAIWESGRLVLIRRVWVNHNNAAQGSVINWDMLKSELLEGISDLLPQADLLPIGNEDDATAYQRRLATIPAVLEPGEIIVQNDSHSGLLRTILTAAWVFMALGTFSVCGLLWGTLRLGKRREDFVSAVTHELRTPITSVTMYAEMLQAGMADDEDKRSRYLCTLRTEAHRLGRLIENVLAFSRIERGKIARRIEKLDLAGVLETIKPRLEDRARQADLEIQWSIPGLTTILADESALEQILFNLVDNAAKYAADAADKRIVIEAKGIAGEVELRVRDFGPGIDRSIRLFKPFSKSAQDAANSAPGVGLGLALSRRLARGMKGDLRHDATTSPGACFVLRLRGE